MHGQTRAANRSWEKEEAKRRKESRGGTRVHRRLPDAGDQAARSTRDLLLCSVNGRPADMAPLAHALARLYRAATAGRAPCTYFGGVCGPYHCISAMNRCDFGSLSTGSLSGAKRGRGEGAAQCYPFPALVTLDQQVIDS